MACYSWQRYCDQLAMALQHEFGDEVEVKGSRDEGVSGRFEVTLVNTGEVIYSKSKTGRKCDSPEDRAGVIAKLKEFLSK